MATITIGDLDAFLRSLEAKITAYVSSSCRYFFGGEQEERQRAKSPPYVAWVIHGGEKEAETREVSNTNQVHYLDDQVRITARCAGLVPSGQQGPDTRRQQLAASLQVMLAVSWALWSTAQGYCDDEGWEVMQNEGASDAYVCIDYTFRIRAGRWTPTVVEVQPNEADATPLIDGGAGDGITVVKHS